MVQYPVYGVQKHEAPPSRRACTCAALHPRVPTLRLSHPACTHLAPGRATPAAACAWCPAQTPAYMAPELAKEGRATKAADVFAFGVLLYELYHQQRAADALAADGGMLPVEQLVLPPEAPAEYAQLMQACLRPRPSERPAFDDVVDVLGRLRGDAQAARLM